jgi:hypothetical protein
VNELEMKTAVAVACGTYDRWVIMKRGLYYRPGAMGYTSMIDEAWIVSEKEAVEHEYPHREDPVTKERAPIPDYPNDLNAMREARKTITGPVLRAKYMNTLREIVGRRMPKNKVGSPLVSDYDCMDATANEHCEAFLRTFGLWKD